MEKFEERDFPFALKEQRTATWIVKVWESEEFESPKQSWYTYARMIEVQPSRLRDRILLTLGSEEELGDGQDRRI